MKQFSNVSLIQKSSSVNTIDVGLNIFCFQTFFNTYKTHKFLNTLAKGFV